MVKVDTKSYTREEIPFEGDKIFQIAVGGTRVYAIGEDGSLQVSFRSDDSQQPAAPQKQSTKPSNQNKSSKDVELSEDDASSTEGRLASVLIKAIKIPDELSFLKVNSPFQILPSLVKSIENG